MRSISRRDFLQRAGAGAAAAGFLAVGTRRAAAEPLGIPIGAQTYPAREMVAQGQFPQLCQKLYAAGVRQIELCSPGYAQFKSLADGKATKKIVDDSGLRVISSHFTMNELRHQLPESLQWAHDLGLVQMGTASLGGRMTDGRTSLNNVKYATQEFNQIGANVNRAGLQLFLHNEGFEDTHLEDGRLTYPVLLDYLDPSLVKMQFQMSGMLLIGDPIMYFNNNPGRFISAHLHGVDFSNASAVPGLPLPVKRTGGRGRGAAPAPPPVAMGEDSVDWPRVFAAAKVGGMKNYFIEQEQPDGGWETMVKDIAYLKTLS
ncbi:MAG TPA: twin-arginine translocation signal domain-containing protein [Terriglobales bacterium]|jgi:sugar phosphate isomerase/epimerase